jgi:hypothetical protein
MKTCLKLDLPYYQQTHPATCGPASLMMVLKYWDKSIDFSRNLELDLWKQSKSFFFKGATFQFGLANSAKRMGFNTIIHQKAKISKYKTKNKFIYDFFEYLVSYKTRIFDIPIIYGENSIDIIFGALEKEIPPLVLVNLEPITGENIFHWIVVTCIDNEMVQINDPDYSEKPRKDVQIKMEIFRRAVATDEFCNFTFPFSFFRFPPAILLVYK